MISKSSVCAKRLVQRGDDVSQTLPLVYNAVWNKKSALLEKRTKKGPSVVAFKLGYDAAVDACLLTRYIRFDSGTFRHVVADRSAMNLFIKPYSRFNVSTS